MSERYVTVAGFMYVYVAEIYPISALNTILTNYSELLVNKTNRHIC